MKYLADSTILETDRLKLSLIQQGNIDAVFETMNCKNTADIVSFLTWPMTLSQAASWCERSVKGLENQNEFLFLACDKYDNFPVGCICLFLLNPNIGEVGYWVSKNRQGCGFATEMLNSTIQLAFNTRELQNYP